MKRNLLSVTDENAILITVEFLESGKILKVGERSIRRYEIELIVKNDITIDQLLIAIEQGLQNRLKEMLKPYKIELDEMAFQFVYEDERHHEKERKELSVEEIAKKAIGILEDKRTSGVVERIRINRAVKEQESLLLAQQKLDEELCEDDNHAIGAVRSANLLEATKTMKNSSQEGMQKEEDFNEFDRFAAYEAQTEEEKERDVYLICWSVFEECYLTYVEAFQQHKNPSEIEKEKYGMSRRPVIGIASIDYNKIPVGTRLCISDDIQISLSDVLESGLRKEVGDCTLKKLGFITGTRLIFDPVSWHKSAPLLDPTQVTEAFKDKAPQYNISERPLRQLDDQAVHIIPPTSAPQKSKVNILTTVLTPLLTTGIMIGVRMVSGSVNVGSTLLMTGAMGGVSALVAIINIVGRNREHRKNLEDWRIQYQNYISRLLTDIQKKQDDDVKKLHQLYPPTLIEKSGRKPVNSVSLVHKALSVDGDIFSHGQEHPDFLTFRVGVSAHKSELVPSVFPIIGEKKEAVFNSVHYQNIKNISDRPFRIYMAEDKDKDDGWKSLPYLIDLPADIAKEYAYLNGAPVRLSLRDTRSLGIVFPQRQDSWTDDFQPFLSSIIFNLCFYHSPEDLQFVMFCEENSDWTARQRITRYYKHLPHFRELLGDLSPFAFHKKDADLILNKLLELLSERKAAEEDTKFPHIVVIVQKDYELKRHPVSEYLPLYGDDEKTHALGISFVFCKRYMEELPKYCEQVIKKTMSERNGEQWFLLPHTQIVSRTATVALLMDERPYQFLPDELLLQKRKLDKTETIDMYYSAFKTVSALYYERIAQGADVPSSVELFDIVISDSKAEDPAGLSKDLRNFIMNSWGMKEDSVTKQKVNVDKTRVTRSLSVPIGKKSGGIVELDLHEKADGPHMLVAGTTGSGKTETILTYLVGLCAKYTPDEVNLLLMDMKGAGFVQRIGDEIQGTRLPHVVGTVTDIAGDETGTGTAYMLKRFLQSMNAEVKKRKLLLNRMGVDSVDSYIMAKADPKKHVRNHPHMDVENVIAMPPLPHLFLVVDEFTELMQFNEENGGVDFRSAITSLARIGRSLGFHIILISQNIENAITPDIRVNSRARLCLKVATRDASREMIGTDLAASPLMPGNGRAYLLVGTGSRFEYFQSGYSGADITRNLQAPIIITNVEKSGEYSLFYDSEDKVSGTSETVSGKKKTGTSQLKMLVEQIKDCFESTTGFKKPDIIFQQPLPNACYYDYCWETDGGKCKILKENNERERG